MSDEVNKGVDYVLTEHVPTVSNVPVITVTRPRGPGNPVFRRYADGTLDVGAAKDLVVDIVHKVADHAPLTAEEEMIAGCLFPGCFQYVAGSLCQHYLNVTLKISPVEAAEITAAVAAHLQEEMSYNAGSGGYPTPHRRA